jgi:hypothetical protein
LVGRIRTLLLGGHCTLAGVALVGLGIIGSWLLVLLRGACNQGSAEEQRGAQKRQTFSEFRGTMHFSISFFDSLSAPVGCAFAAPKNILRL